MKKLLLILISITSCSEKGVLSSTLVERNGIMHEVNNDNPFSGKVFDKYENQQFKMIGQYSKGLKTGTWEYYKDNGQITEKSDFYNGKLDDKNILLESKNYKQGKFDGIYEIFRNKRVVINKGLYKNGAKSGKWIEQYDKDNIKSEMVYENGKLISHKEWDTNNKITRESIYP